MREDDSFVRLDLSAELHQRCGKSGVNIKVDESMFDVRKTKNSDH